MEQRIVIATRSEIPERGSKKFTFERDGVTEEGFLIRYKGRFFAYRNLCNHIPLKMDQDTGMFFSPSGSNLVCKNHGAMFDPLTGKCILGPPKGKYLKWLSIAVTGETIYLILKDARPAAPAPTTCPGDGDSCLSAKPDPASAASGQCRVRSAGHVHTPTELAGADEPHAAKPGDPDDHA